MFIGLPRNSQLSFRNKEKPLAKLIEKEFNLPSGELFAHTRRQDNVGGRQLFASIMYHAYPSMSLSEIGKEMGKDHATVLHCCKKTAIFLVLEEDFRHKAIAVISAFMRYRYPSMADWFIIRQTGVLIEKMMVNEKRQERKRNQNQQATITIPSRMSEAETA